MNASPAMETGGPLLCFDASVVLRSEAGTRSVAIAELFAGPGQTTAAPDELLEAVEVPLPPRATGSCYLRLEYRRQMEIAVVGATAVLTLAGDVVADARVAITALAPTIRRVPAAEAALLETDAGPTAAGAAAATRGGRGRADLGRPRLRPLPAGDGRGRHPARDRDRRRTGSRRGGAHPSERRARGRSGMKVAATLRVNGIAYPVELDPHSTLLRAVREQIGLTGSKEGCDDSECGACMMLLDGEPVNACSYLALQAEGGEITTVEGLAPPGELSPLQHAFLEHGGVQCGFCTPGMLISATALLRRTPAPSEDEVRIALSGNLCRCTGYDGIVKAVLAVAGESEG